MTTQNSIVAKALNAVARNGYVKLYAKAGGTATVYEGDKVEYDGKVYTAKALGSPSMDSATLVDDAGNKLVVKMKDYKLKALNEDTSVVSEKAMNAKFYATGYTNGGANEKQIGPFKTKEEAIKAGREEQGASGTFRFAGVVGEDGTYVYHNSRARNASSSPFGFFVGEQVVIKKDPSNKKYRVKEITETGDIRLEGATPLFDASELDTANYVGPYRAANAKFKVGDKVYFHGRPATVKQVIREPDADYILDVQGDDFYAEDEEVTLRNSRACNSTNPIVRKAMNAEDAQGHEHGSDGKFTSKGGGSKKDSEDFHSHIDSLAAKAASGEDGYEDPKTKRMKERLAKMREKNEALRKDNERRRAALVGKRAELDKMRADIMKANVDRWKAGVSASKNAVVAKAMNTVARNAKYKTAIIKPEATGSRFAVYGIDDSGRSIAVARHILESDAIDVALKIAPHVKRESAMARNAVARNTDNDFVQYYADSYSYIPKVGEIYKYDGKRVKCTSVQKLQRGNDDRDRFLVEGRVVG